MIPYTTTIPGTDVNPPETKVAKDEFWAADHEDIRYEINDRLGESGGKGALGIVDPNLPADIEQLKKDR